MNYFKNKNILIGIFLWQLIIAIPQFNMNYSTGLLSGKLEYGQIPNEFYFGLFAGIIGSLFFLGAGILVLRLCKRFGVKEMNGPKIYLYITLLFFTIMLLTQGKDFYNLISLDEIKVKEARQLIIDYESNNTNN